MSRKANAEKVESNFELFAEKAGWETSELAKHVHETFSESEDTDLMNGIDFEESEEMGVNIDEMAFNDLQNTVSKGVDKGLIDQYPGNSKDDLKGALMALSDSEMAKVVKGEPEESEESESDKVQTGSNSEKPESWLPYSNDAEWYESREGYDIEAIQDPQEMRNSEKWNETDNIDQIRHNQAKNGVCEVCKVYYAGNGDTCNQCDSNDSNDSSHEVTIAEIQEAFGVNSEEARKARENKNKGLYPSIKDAIEA